MAKYVMTTYQKRKHEKAFDFYAEQDAQGKRRSNATIAGLVGVSPSAIAYWKRRDNWDGQLLASIDEQINEADLTNRNIKKLLRESLFNHIKSLNRVIEHSKSDGDKVTAIKAFVHIAKELDCLTSELGAPDPATHPTFQDDLNEPAEQASEGTAGTDPSADGAGSPIGVGSGLEAGSGTAGSDPVFALPVAALPEHEDHLERGFAQSGL